MDVKLVAQSGRSQGQAVALSAAKFFIGSHSNCQLRPAIDGLAGIHALIEQREGRVLVRDFGAEGGTAINDRVLHSKEYEVSHGDVLKIGPLVLSFAIGSRGAAVPALEPAPVGWPFSEQPTLEAAATPAGPPTPSIPEPAAAQHAGIPTEELTSIRYETVGDVLVVTLLSPDLLEETTVGPMRFELKDLLDQDLPRRVVLDLACVNFMSSRAVGVILAHYQGIDRVGGSLRVCRAQSKVMPVLQQMRLNMLLEVFPTVEDALRGAWE